MDYVAEERMEELEEYNMNMNGEKPEPVYIKREKQQPPSLSPQKHPHGQSHFLMAYPYIMAFHHP